MKSILITNDDGIEAPGIRALWEALRHVADAKVVAPLYEQSAVGLSTTIRSPLLIRQHTWDNQDSIFSVNGTPADCIKLALNVVLKQRPDLILSGINRGSNAGRNALYSGTVSAAIEGTMQDVPSIALSCSDYHTTPDYTEAANWVVKLITFIDTHPMPKGTLLNVNFPLKADGIKGMKLTHQGMQYLAENPTQREHPAEGQHYYWLGARFRTFTEQDDCDIRWLEQGYISVVPIQIHQLTEVNYVQKARSYFEPKDCSLSNASV